jgi:hypothetical protein
MPLKKKAWSEGDIERLKGMVASGVSAVRASIALKRSLVVTKRKASQLGFPFRTDAELRKDRHRIFEDAASPRH